MNVGSEGAQDLLRSHDELIRHQEENDLLAVMAMAEGRRFIWRLIGLAGVFKQSFAEDALSTAFNEGKRSVGLALLVRLQNEAPDSFLKAQGESIESQKVHQQLVAASEAEAEREQRENEIV